MKEFQIAVILIGFCIAVYVIVKMERNGWK